jgi:hypothetical protein
LAPAHTEEMRLGQVLNWFDRRQRSRSVLGFPLAVWLKYSEDQGRYLGAIVTYYAFFSLFPLLLVAATVLGFVLRGDPSLQRSVGRSVLGTFPIVGHDLRVHALTGNGVALGVGLTLALWAGNRVFIRGGERDGSHLGYSAAAPAALLCSPPAGAPRGAGARQRRCRDVRPQCFRGNESSPITPANVP